MINPNRIIQSLYYQILRIRLVEEEIAARYKEQQMRCPVHLCIGQEAVSVGICSHLTKKDIVFSNHRSHGHYLAKGGNLKRMIAEIYGKETGCSKGRGGSQHLIDTSVNFLGATPIVAQTIPVAVGAALAAKLGRRRQIVVSFFGDAAMEEGVAHESFNFAVLKKLPILFVCENNLYSTYTHIKERQPERFITKLATGYGMPVLRIDGNNVLDVYNLTQKTIKIVRDRESPVFLEFLTYRYREHVGPNYDPKGFRNKQELDYWQRRDPLRIIEKNADLFKLLSESHRKKMKIKIEREIKDAFMYAVKSPYPREIPEENQVYAP